MSGKGDKRRPPTGDYGVGYDRIYGGTEVYDACPYCGTEATEILGVTYCMECDVCVEGITEEKVR